MKEKQIIGLFLFIIIPITFIYIMVYLNTKTNSPEWALNTLYIGGLILWLNLVSNVSEKYKD